MYVVRFTDRNGKCWYSSGEGGFTFYPDVAEKFLGKDALERAIKRVKVDNTFEILPKTLRARVKRFIRSEIIEIDEEPESYSELTAAIKILRKNRHLLKSFVKTLPVRKGAHIPSTVDDLWSYDDWEEGYDHDWAKDSRRYLRKYYLFLQERAKKRLGGADEDISSVNYDQTDRVVWVDGNLCNEDKFYEDELFESDMPVSFLLT